MTSGFPAASGIPKGPVWNVDYWQFAIGDHVKTLGGRLVAGRALQPSDDEHGQLVAMAGTSPAFVAPLLAW